MTTQREPLATRVQRSFLELSEIASDLNSVSDELGECASEIDGALKKLNLGIEVWVSFHDWDENGHDYYKEQLGYGKVDGKWGISIRTVSGCYQWPDEDKIEMWHFNDAPRKTRLASIEKLPEVLSALSKQSAKMIEEIRGRLAEVKEVAGAVKAAAEAPTPEKKRLIDMSRGGVKK
jgi:hypothetical protein